MKLYGWTFRPEQMKPLECDICGAVFGWVDELDLNGSYFACHGCRAQAMPKVEEKLESPETRTPCGETCGRTAC